MNHRGTSCVWALLASGLAAAPALASYSVVDPGTPVLGLSQGQWADRWWQHMAAIPAADNPVLDTTGAKAHFGDAGPVFFLAGSLGGDVHRTATVRDDQYLFFPVVNGLYYQQDPLVETEEFMRSELDAALSSATNLLVGENGDGFADVRNHRQTSAPGLLPVVFPADNFFDIPAGTYQTVSDGFWIMLEPLRQGRYQLDFGGVFPGATPAEDFEVHAFYDLIVVPAPGTGVLALVGMAAAGRRRR